MQVIDLEGGFVDPVLDSQRGFHALMDALANPGTIRSLSSGLMPPSPLTPELAAVALTLCDHDSPLWLEPRLLESEAVTAWLRFHTGAPIVTDPAQADFALVTDVAMLPPLGRFALGSDQYPDRSTTIALVVTSLSGGVPLTIEGPGIEKTAVISPLALGADWLDQWGENRALFPRGIDLLLVADGEVVGLPRTTRISPAEQ